MGRPGGLGWGGQQLIARWPRGRARGRSDERGLARTGPTGLRGGLGWPERTGCQLASWDVDSCNSNSSSSSCASANSNSPRAEARRGEASLRRKASVAINLLARQAAADHKMVSPKISELAAVEVRAAIAGGEMCGRDVRCGSGRD